MPIDDEDVQSVFDSVNALSDGELKELAAKLDQHPSLHAHHLARFVRSHFRKQGKQPNRFGDATRLTQEIFANGFVPKEYTR